MGYQPPIEIAADSPYLDAVNVLIKSVWMSHSCNSRRFAVIVDGKPVAVACMSKAPAAEYIGLHSAVVDPDHRSNGLHKLLIKTRCNVARREGFKYAVASAMDQSISFVNLIDCGFCLCEPVYGVSTYGALTLCKKL